MIKETVEKLMAILSSKGWTYNILIFRHQFTYILNKRNGFLRSLFHTAKHIIESTLPTGQNCRQSYFLWLEYAHNTQPCCE